MNDLLNIYNAITELNVKEEELKYNPTAAEFVRAMEQLGPFVKNQKGIKINTSTKQMFAVIVYFTEEIEKLKNQISELQEKIHNLKGAGDV